MARQSGTGSTPEIDIDLGRIADFCRRHHICSAALFGSVLGQDFGPSSDIDILVRFEDGHTPGWELFDLELELSEILGRRVDLNTAGFLNRSFRQRVLEEAQILYAA
jgi:predicted nucleotidyltransferase